MAESSAPHTAHVSEHDMLIDVESPKIVIRIESPADTEEMSIDGLSADGSHAWYVCSSSLCPFLQMLMALPRGSIVEGVQRC